MSQRNDQIGELQGQVDQTVTIMRDNLRLGLDRDGKLTDLDARAEELAQNAAEFQKTTNQVGRKMWLAQAKMKILLGVAIIVPVVVIILIIVLMLT